MKTEQYIEIMLLSLTLLFAFGAAHVAADATGMYKQEEFSQEDEFLLYQCLDDYTALYGTKDTIEMLSKCENVVEGIEAL